jgi:hypothetical protein
VASLAWHQGSKDPSVISNKDWNRGVAPGFILAFAVINPMCDMRLNVGTGTQELDVTSTVGTLCSGEWHHVAATFERRGSGVAIALYVDGVPQGRATASTFGDTSSSLPIVVGQDGTTRYSDGYHGATSIDEVRGVGQRVG